MINTHEGNGAILNTSRSETNIYSLFDRSKQLLEEEDSEIRDEYDQVYTTREPDDIMNSQSDKYHNLINRQYSTNIQKQHRGGQSWQKDVPIHQRMRTGINSIGRNPAFSSNIGGTTVVTGGGSTAGGLEVYMDCDDVDIRYLEEVIYKVKESQENQYQLSEFIEAVLMEYEIQTNEEWDALIAESKEMQKTLKKVIDISVFLLDKQSQLNNDVLEMDNINSSLMADLQALKDQNDCLADEIKGYQQKSYNYQKALKTQEQQISFLNDQLQAQQDLIKRLEQDTHSNNNSFSKSFTKSNLKPDNTDIHNLLSEKTAKVNELENLIAEQTSKYHSEIYKNQNLSKQVRKFKEDGENLKIQLEELNNILEEKVTRLDELEEEKKRLEDLLTIKEAELKKYEINIERKQTIKIRNPIVATQIKLDEDRQCEVESEYSFAKKNNNQNQSTLENRKKQRLQKLSMNENKWSEILEKAVNKLVGKSSQMNERKSIKLKNSQKNMLQPPLHKRLQTFDLNSFKPQDINGSTLEVINENQEKPLNNKKQKHSPQVIIEGHCGEDYSHEYERHAQDPISFHQHMPYFKQQEQKQEEVYLEFDEPYSEFVDESVRVKNDANKSNIIGINESDLMEFQQNYFNSRKPSEYEKTGRLNETSNSVRFSQFSKKGDAILGIVKNDNKNESLRLQQSPKTPQIVMINNYNITSNENINNFMSDPSRSNSEQINPFFKSPSKYETTEKLPKKSNNDYSEKLKKNEQETPKLAFSKLQAEQRKYNKTKISNQNFSKVKDSYDEFKADLLQQKIKGLQSGKITQTPSKIHTPYSIGTPKSQFNNLKQGQSDLNCITMDYDEMDIMAQRNCLISAFGCKKTNYQHYQFIEHSRIRGNTFDNNDKTEMNQQASYQFQDALKVFFHFTALSYLMRHQERTYLFSVYQFLNVNIIQLDIEVLYQEALQKQIKFFEWSKWIQKRMIDHHYENKRKTRDVTNQSLLENEALSLNLTKYQIIDDHFQK